METYKLDQLIEIAKDQGYKHVRLLDLEGNSIVAYNPASMSVDKRIDEMKTRIKSPALKDGYLCFEGKQYLRSDAKADKYYIVKGTPKEDIDLNPEPAKPKEKNALSFKEAIKLNKTIAELRAELEYALKEGQEWQAKYNSLMDDVEEIMDEEPEEEEEGPKGMSEMSENTKTFVSETIATLTPMVDRHYDMKEKELEIKEGKVLVELAKQGYKVPVNGEQIEEHTESEEEEPAEEMAEGTEMDEEEFNAWVTEKLTNLAETDPARYKVVAESANSGGDIVDLLNGGTGFDPEEEGAE